VKPTERQLIALLLKSEGLSLSEIARLLDTSKQNVASLIKRGKENVEKYETLYKVMKACTSKKFKIFPSGESLFRVAEEVMKMADESSIKLKGNVNDVASYIKMEGRVEEGALKVPHGVALCEDGKLVVLTDASLDEFSKLLSVYRRIKVKGSKGNG